MARATGREATATDTIVAVPGKAALTWTPCSARSVVSGPASEYRPFAGTIGGPGLDDGNGRLTRCSVSARCCSASRWVSPSASATLARSPATAGWRSTSRPGNSATASTRSIRRRCCRYRGEQVPGEQRVHRHGHHVLGSHPSETFTPAWLLHFDIPLNDSSDRPAATSSVRADCSSTTTGSTTYNFWAGIRVRFGKN